MPLNDIHLWSMVGKSHKRFMDLLIKNLWKNNYFSFQDKSVGIEGIAERKLEQS